MRINESQLIISSAHSKGNILKEIPGISHRPLVSIFRFSPVLPRLAAPLTETHHHTWSVGSVGEFQEFCLFGL